MRGNDVYQKEGCCLYPNESLLGGWCRVHYMRNGKERSAYKEVALAEYDKGQANWKTKPSTMINKVAISQCVREAFPKDYEGLYSEEEMIASGAIPAVVIDPETGEVTGEDDDPIITDQQHEAFCKTISSAFPDKTKDEKAKIYRRILDELEVVSKDSMRCSELSRAINMALELAKSEKDETEQPVEQ